VSQLDDILRRVTATVAMAGNHDVSDVGDATLIEFITLLASAVDRLAPRGSVYASSAKEIRSSGDLAGYRVKALIGVARALREDYAAGYVTSVEEILHADVFADFLEMADELLGKGYKDAAAVIAGTVLEEQLRKLAGRANLTVQDDQGKPLKAERLNADLTKATVYNALDQKSVTAWLGLRNDAAHGHYERYDEQQVRLVIEGVRNFVARHPA
jgi:hypothetical protein